MALVVKLENWIKSILGPGPALAIVGIWGVNQQIHLWLALPLSFCVVQIKQRNKT